MIMADLFAPLCAKDYSNHWEMSHVDVSPHPGLVIDDKWFSRFLGTSMVV